MSGLPRTVGHETKNTSERFLSILSVPEQKLSQSQIQVAFSAFRAATALLTSQSHGRASVKR